MSPKIWILIAGLSGALAVTMGAYGAHGLSKSIDATLSRPIDEYVEVDSGDDLAEVRKTEIARRIANWNNGARYHLAHAGVLFAVALAAARWPSRCWHIAGTFLVLGMLMFSGGLYVSAFVTLKGLGYVVMSGGLCYTAGWMATAVAALRLPRDA